MSLRPDDLGSFLIDRRQTLSVLTVTEIRLIEGDWDQLASTLGDSLRLNRVNLFMVSKASGLPLDSIHEYELEDAVLQIMKWVSVEELVTQIYEVSGPAPFENSGGGAVGYRKGYAPTQQEKWLD